MFSKTFKSYLIENADQLDISIQAAGKYLTNAKKIEEFLTSNVTVEHKTDGIKVTIIKQSDNGNINDYIVAYKGNVLYSTEYDYQPDTKVKTDSIGASQFKLIFKHLDSLGKNSIPVGTELFVEYLMSKPTLSSNYSTKHKMVLIGYSKSSWDVKFGKLKTSNSGFNTEKRNDYAKELKIDYPQLLFKGVIGSALTFERGIINSNLLKEFKERQNSITWDVPEILLDDIRQLFLAVESKYGGVEEGVVVLYNDKMLKFQQEYQVDQAARAAIKSKYKEDSEESESAYWKNVTGTALNIVNGMTIKSRKLDDLLGELSLVMKRLKLDFTHSKKSLAIIKDDIQLTAKTQIIKKLKGNNNALIIGKFRVLTKDGHYKLIKRASTLYDNVVVCVVTSKDTKETAKMRKEMLTRCFPNVEIIDASNGNLSSILGKSPININVVYAGSDRVSEYVNQLRHTLGTEVREMERSSSDISATKVIDNIEDEDYFKQNTPKEIHSMYQEIKKAYM